VGHEWAVRLLSEHIANGRTRQAYLFTGPQGTGRRTLALRFFMALNCQNPPQPGQICNACQACRRIEKMEHPDLDLVQAEQEGGILVVDQIRGLQRSLSLSPYEARFRMGLLLRFEEANIHTANALLKTLEEPAPHVVLVLTAESAESLLPTIVSRCMVLRLGPVALPTVQESLQSQWGLAAQEATLLAHLSGGRVGYALKLHQDSEMMDQRNRWLDEMSNLLKQSRVARFDYVEKLDKEKDKERTRQMLQVWLSFWRDVMLGASRTAINVTNLDRAEQIENIASTIDLNLAVRTVNAIQRTIKYLESNVNSRLALEVLALDLPGIDGRN